MNEKRYVATRENVGRNVYYGVWDRAKREMVRTIPLQVKKSDAEAFAESMNVNDSLIKEASQ